MDRESENDENRGGVAQVWKGYGAAVCPTIVPHVGVVSLALGQSFGLLLTTEHKVLCFGLENNETPLGLGSHIRRTSTPTALPFFANRLVTDVFCGPAQSAALTDDGALYMWGRNDSGQCGHLPVIATEDDHHHSAHLLESPTEVILRDHVHVCPLSDALVSLHVRLMQVSCGERHTLAVDVGGSLWAWGAYQRLGLGDAAGPALVPPGRVSLPVGRRALSVACGTKHSLALLTCDQPTKTVTTDRNSRSGCVPCDAIDEAVKRHHGRLVVDYRRCPLGLPIDDAEIKSSPGSPLPSRTVSSKDKRTKEEENGGTHRRLTKRLQAAVGASPDSARVVQDVAGEVPVLATPDTNDIANVKIRERLSAGSSGNSEADKLDDQSPRGPPDGLTIAFQNSSGFSLPVTNSSSVSLEQLSECRDARLELSTLDTTSSSFALCDTTFDDSFDYGELCAATVESSRGSSNGCGNKRATMPIRGLNLVKGDRDSVVEGGGGIQSVKKFLSQQLLRASVADPLDARRTADRKDRLASTLPSPMAHNAVEKFHFVSKYDWESEERHGLGLHELERSVERSSDDGPQNSSGPSSNSSAQSLDVDSNGAVVQLRRKRSTAHRQPIGSSCECLGKSSTTTIVPLVAFHSSSVTESQLRDCSRQTEVWSWGGGGHGQLGLGDALDRANPTCIRSLSDVGVVKVDAGHAHSLAVLASGEVYAWGSNSHGQLSREAADETACSPMRISITDSRHQRALVCDAVAGHRHSVFLISVGGAEQKIEVCGRQEGAIDRAENIGTSKLTPHPTSGQGRVRQVFAGGPFTGCVLDDYLGSYSSFLYELNDSELQFYSMLHVLNVAVVRPLLKEDAATVGPALRRLLEKHMKVANNAAHNAHHLHNVIRRPERNGVLPVLHDVEQQFALFRRYCGYFCDALAVSSFATVVKALPRLFKRAAGTLRKLGAEEEPAGGRSTGTISAETFQHLMEEPIRRMSQYGKIFENLAEQHLKRKRACVWERDVAARWARLVVAVSAGKADAEKTRAFWDTCTSKVVEALRQPGRRVLRDSKSCPAGLLNGGRFSSHWFVLFDDCFAHCQYSGVNSYDLSLLWVDSPTYLDNGGERASFKLTFPEDSFALVCDTALAKSEWIAALNDAVNARLRSTRESRSRATGSLDKVSRKSSVSRRLPPLTRSANYVFAKHSLYKDACYSGAWFCGQMQGYGELTWPDNRRYAGSFRRNERDGYGTYTVGVPNEATVYDGRWRGDRMDGLGSIRYANGDTYEGFFRNGMRHGHGVLKHGSFVSAGSIYVGQWANDKRHGYGVMDSVDTGEKYMGIWQEDARHGSGMVVTLDSVYYEGSFVLDKMTGLGLVYDDGSWFRGEVGPDGRMAGRGTLTLASGEIIDGTFSGSWGEGVRVNGTLNKSTTGGSRLFTSSGDLIYPNSYATLCVDADDKWLDIFGHCRDMLGIDGKKTIDTQRAWEAVAVSLANFNKYSRDKSSVSSSAGATVNCRKVSVTDDDLGLLERIPQHDEGEELTAARYRDIRVYLGKAFDTLHHPLGRLMIGLVDVYRATYVGIGAHPCLLYHAVQEVNSFVRRIYEVVRVLFPVLPAVECEIVADEIDSNDPLAAEEADSDPERSVDGSRRRHLTITPQSLLLPVLLPKIYPPLFTLYAYACEKEDAQYWETLLKWNKQPDLSLMAFLGVDEKFRPTMDDRTSGEARLRVSMSVVRDAHYRVAINTLQQMSTTFSPLEKLRIIQKVFEAINEDVMPNGGDGNGHVWTMDDLFPVFQYVVIRAAIRHLGSEIRLVDDLMERRLQNGELGIMFTMLKASYFQVRNEKSLAI